MLKPLFRLVEFFGASLALLAAPTWSQAAGPLEFNRDIRPILADQCLHCHGPDPATREADLRLDSFAGATADLGGYQALAPGDAEASELVRRILSADPDERMPPADTKRALTEDQKQLLVRWVEQGGEYQNHWAFESIESPTPPAKDSLKQPAWPRNAIDQFVLAALERENLAPSAEADRRTLARRVALDLTGLPPTPEEVEAFVNDARPDAYERLVVKLLASPHCAERLALDWLDAARYADTNGYSIDDHREMWAWRDWVIHAFLTNKPYDEFLVEQLAGDLLPDATEQQRVATGFLRNSMNTHEGGIIPEEYRVAYTVDKLDTVATAVMGLTLKCAQCHDHKYDPLSQREFYQFYAFFNTSSEPGHGATNGNTQPTLAVTSILQDPAASAQSLQARIAALRTRLRYPDADLTAARRVWERDQLAKQPTATANTEAATAQSAASTGPFPHPPRESAADRSAWIWAKDKSASEKAYFRREFKLAAAPRAAWLFVACDNAAEVWINGKPLGAAPDWRMPTTWDVTAQLAAGDNLLAIEGVNSDGPAGLFALLAYETADGQMHYLGTDASWQAAAQSVAEWNTARALKTLWPAAQVIATHGDAPWGRVLKENEAQAAARFVTALRTPEPARDDAQWEVIVERFAADVELMAQTRLSILEEIKILQATLDAGRTSAMVMDASQANRKTFILLRGQYDQPGEEVAAGTPAALPPLEAERPADRLDLARWLVRDDHPLTARVAVNRYWQLLFGVGLVKTTEDFGTQGELPSHAKLLDWLAHDFVEHGWDVRRLLRQMVLSATYRQQSEAPPEAWERDPENRQLARGARFRLPAELVRDNALAIAGLLSTELGGPSVYPYQPPGLWQEVSHFGHPQVFTAQAFYQDQAASLYRRSMYTFWKRTSPPPSMMVFDAPSRETCTVRRQTTNTPLQALVLLNDPQYVESARALAARMLTDGGATPAARLAYGFERATARPPSDAEAALLLRAYERQQARFAADPAQARALLAIGESPLPTALDPVEHAAYTLAASLILNLNETITRQ